ncbi:MAG: hypothetical protein IKJ24_04460, partial [Clostridia bacterium]|nr:hypothetical protein [Clostridia bacterium]
MGKCSKCYGEFDYIPGIGVCIGCRNTMNSNQSSQKETKQNQRSTVQSAPMDPKVATVICVILAIALVLGVIWLVMHIYNNNAANMVMEEITSTYSDDGSDIAASVLTREDNKTNWSISVTDYKKGF